MVPGWAFHGPSRVPWGPQTLILLSFCQFDKCLFSSYSVKTPPRPQGAYKPGKGETGIQVPQTQAESRIHQERTKKWNNTRSELVSTRILQMDKRKKGPSLCRQEGHRLQPESKPGLTLTSRGDQGYLPDLPVSS